MGSPGGTCQDQGKTHAERPPAVPKRGKRSSHERPSPLQEERGERGAWERKRAAPVRRMRLWRWSRRLVTSSRQPRKSWDSSQRGQGGQCRSSRCSRPLLAVEGRGAEATRTATTSARTWRSPQRESSRQSSSLCGQGANDGHGGEISMPTGTAVLWLGAPGDHSRCHQRWGRLGAGKAGSSGDRQLTAGTNAGRVLGPKAAVEVPGPSLGA